MGVQLKGAFGGFQGKTGPLVGVIVKGQNVITSLHRKSNKPPTQKQLDVRSRFGLMTDFLGYIGDVISIGFQHHDETLSPMNAAVAYNMKHAITGATPDFKIDYPALSFSRGKLRGPKGALAEPEADAVIQFSWGSNAQKSFLSNLDDQLILMVYNPEQNEFITLINAASRSENSYTLQLPADFSGNDVHCYMSFVSETGRVSNSSYAGTITIL